MNESIEPARLEPRRYWTFDPPERASLRMARAWAICCALNSHGRKTCGGQLCRLRVWFSIYGKLVVNAEVSWGHTPRPTPLGNVWQYSRYAIQSIADGSGRPVRRQRAVRRIAEVGSIGNEVRLPVLISCPLCRQQVNLVTDELAKELGTALKLNLTSEGPAEPLGNPRKS